MGMRKDIINVLLHEASAYTSVDQIEKFVQEGRDLSALPVQPLYMVIRQMMPESLALKLDRFSSEQRQIFTDLDLWRKDDFDMENFPFWLKTYSACPVDYIKEEFVKSEEFLLFLKARFNIWTFDVEDPHYPDHDNYFVTEDNLLLFEFDEDCFFIDEVRHLISHLYYMEGVEKAYARLFKIVCDSMMVAQEEEYEHKKARLADLGFIDYYDALGLDYPFANEEVMDGYIVHKKKVSARVDELARSQALHSSALIAYKEGMESFSDELSKVQDSARLEFLRFNFIRLVNASITLSGSLKEGQVAMTRTGMTTKSIIKLGFSYIRNKIMHVRDVQHDDSLFDYYDFVDCHRVGKTLIRMVQKSLKKSMDHSSFNESYEYFLGAYWNEYLAYSYDLIPKVSINKKVVPVDNVEAYILWKEKARTLIELIPFVEAFFSSFLTLKLEGRLQDSFYLNYTVADIDFESILLSSLANYQLGNFQSEHQPKMGLHIDEMRRWGSMILDSNGNLLKGKESIQGLKNFIEQFGLGKIFRVLSYVQDLLTEHLEGYRLAELPVEEFKHVGGPIIFVAEKKSCSKDG